MPQLNPNPWFFTMVISWLSLISFFFTKLLMTTLINPLPPYLNSPSTPNWIWSWI